MNYDRITSYTVTVERSGKRLWFWNAVAEHEGCPPNAGRLGYPTSPSGRTRDAALRKALRFVAKQAENDRLRGHLGDEFSVTVRIEGVS